MSPARIEEADLIEYCLGTLDAKRVRLVEDARDHDPEIASALVEIAQSLEAVAEATARISPSPALRERVVGSVEKHERLQGFAARLAKLFSISLNDAENVLSQADMAPAAPWKQMPLPGTFILRVKGGAGLVARCALVYLERGARIPRHRHLGLEHMLILDGYASEDTGREVGPGDVVISDAGSEHEFDITADTSCLIAVSLEHGLQWVRWRDKFVLGYKVLRNKLRKRS